MTASENPRLELDRRVLMGNLALTSWRWRARRWIRHAVAVGTVSIEDGLDLLAAWDEERAARRLRARQARTIR